MTGYGRAEGWFEDLRWVWEGRAVNGKGLEIRLRLPIGFESLDPAIRKQVSAVIHRGNLQISLDVTSENAGSGARINSIWLQELIECGNPYVEAGLVAKPCLDGLYRVRGVVIDNIFPASDPKLAARNSKFLKSLDVMLGGLKAAREAEGGKMLSLLMSHVAAFDKLVKRARTCEGAQPGQIKEKFDAKFTELLSGKLDTDRLTTEVAILASKADVREELDRLDAHLEQVKSLLTSERPIGRKLDFLAQEFIREINTLCSKSTDVVLTGIGLEMKSLIAQFREQAANVE